LRYIYRLDDDHWAYILNVDENNGEPSANRKKDVGEIIDKFELIGGLVVFGIVDEKLAIEVFVGSAVLRCWYLIKKSGFIDYIRNQREPLYGRYFEDLACRTYEYLILHPQKDINYFNPDNHQLDIPNLANFLSRKENEGIRPHRTENI
jgi:hypothetical protein